MTRNIIILCSFIIILCVPAYAGYTIVTEEYQPAYRTVNGPYGPELYPTGNTPETIDEVCRPANFSNSSSDPARRRRVINDPVGTASSADLFAACPEIRTKVSKKIRKEGEIRLTNLAAPYSSAERETWATQRSQAEEWQMDPQCSCTMLRQMAATRGISPDSLVAKIMENVTLFESASGAILGEQQKLLDRIQTEQDFEQLLSIKWGTP